MSHFLKESILPVLRDALRCAYPDQEDVPIPIERSKNIHWGDLSSTVAVSLASKLKQSPHLIAQTIVSQICSSDSRFSVAPNGFINIHLSGKLFVLFLNDLLAKGSRYGFSEKTREPVIIEFVSANPTGPLHVGHARQGAIGDVLANILTTQGWRVHREFYYNDSGNQIDHLAFSVQARLNNIGPDDPEWPKDGYCGDYISDIASQYTRDAHPQNDLPAIKQFAVDFLRKEQNADLHAFGIQFDQFYLESSLYRDGSVERLIKTLTDYGDTYEENNALWLSTTRYGDNKNRVMRKTDGSLTYFVPDVAYHLNKWSRGFKRAINIQGSDHHGTIARVKAGLQGARQSIPADYPEYILHSMVKIVRDGHEVKLSKRAGSYVTLRDLLHWIGKDCARFFLVLRKADSDLVLDLNLALKKK